MSDGGPRASWAEACRALRLVALDPSLGILVRGPAGPARDLWLAGLRGHMPGGAPWRRLPAGTPVARLVGGLDLAATLASGRPVAAPGLLAEADGGVLVVAAAERLDHDAAAMIGHAIDTGALDGAPARFAAVALDDGREPDERTPDALADRLALRLDLGLFGHRDCGPIPPDAGAIGAARRGLRAVSSGPDAVEALCEAALALGVAGVRAPLLAVKAARAAAALDGRRIVSPDDIALAARLVLGPRATRNPTAAEPEETADDAPGPGAPPERRDDDRDTDAAGERQRLSELTVEAARSALPAEVLAGLRAAAALPKGLAGGRRGGATAPGRRGRPLPPRQGAPGRDRALDVLATLRAAAPWQRLRGRTKGGRVLIRRDDLRVRAFEDRQRTTAVVAVDASGSAAMTRLAEAKGAVELILAECYLRRDEVALVAFRGTGAELLLPPTRALARAKRELAALPGGGGTPLAAGLALALDVARAAVRAGRRPVIALLTDGRGNVARDGSADRPRAMRDAVETARLIRAAGTAALVIDVSPRPGPAARTLAVEMGARYLPLPVAGAGAIAGAVLAESRKAP